MKENQAFVQRLRRALRRYNDRSSLDLSDATSRKNSMVAQNKAAAARDKKDIDNAKAWYREAIMLDPSNSGAFLNYINFLISVNESTLALEITQLLLTADPSSPDGMEFLFELGRNLGVDNAIITQALNRFNESVVHKPGRHRDALDFLIPHKKLDSLAEIANKSSDPIARAVSTAHLELGNNTNLEGILNEITKLPERPLVLAHLWLARGKPSAAIEALRALPKADIPERSLRRAIRRSRASEKMSAARSTQLFT